mgnify:CR=1 FL=1
MINILKTTIQNKKLYFIIPVSNLNTSIISTLITSKIVCSFYQILNKKSNYYVVFLNYNFAFFSTISGITKTLKKKKFQINKHIENVQLNNNFNFYLNKNNFSKNNIKFR